MVVSGVEAARGVRTRTPGGLLRTVHELPTPPGAWPLLGHARQIDVEKLHLQLEGWASTYGGLYRLQLGRNAVVVVSEPAVVAQVLKGRPRRFRRRKQMAEIIEEVGVRGVFTAEGRRWGEHRKLALRALGQHALPGFSPLLHRIAGELHARWTANAGQPTAILDDFVCFTVDVTTELAFADRAGSLAGERSSLLADLDPIFPAIGRRLYSLFPRWRWFRSADDRELDAAVARVRTYLEETVAKARANPERASFLGLMLDETDGAGSFDEAALFGNAVTMLLAGEDTTANTLAWAVHLLLDHPEVYQRMRDEADAFEGPIAADPAALALPYTEAVIHEVMRLKPVGPILFLEPLEDLELGDLAVRAGQSLMVLTRQGAMDPAVFPQPQRFDPERWSDPARIVAVQKEGRFVPFGSGPRICPGRALALVELRLVLSMLAKGFDLERVGASDQVEEVNGFTMSPRGLRVVLRPRAA